LIIYKVFDRAVHLSFVKVLQRFEIPCIFVDSEYFF